MPLPCVPLLWGEKNEKIDEIVYSTLEVFYDENEMTFHKKDVFTFVRLQSTDFGAQRDKIFDFQMVQIQLVLQSKSDVY